MADRMSAEIWIGGAIPTSLVKDLCGYIRSEDLSLDYGEESFEPYTAADLLKGTPRGGALRLCSDEVAWGAFQDLEDWLRENNIPYTRKSDGKYEHDPEVVEFRPEEGLHECIANKALEPVVSVEKIRKAVATLRTATEFLAGGHDQIRQGASKTEAAIYQLQEALPPELPPLPPFEVEPDVTQAVEYYRLLEGGTWDTAYVEVPERVVEDDERAVHLWIRDWAAKQDWGNVPVVAAGLYCIPEPEEEPDLVAEEESPPRLTAVFRPQAWRNDQAIDIDHSVRFDATAKILRLSAGEIRSFRYFGDESDALAEDLPARKDHTGPFEVDVDLDIWLEEHGVEDRRSITDAQWEAIRAIYPCRASDEGQ